VVRTSENRKQGSGKDGNKKEDSVEVDFITLGAIYEIHSLLDERERRYD
jgi:hypothetical protein